MAEFRDRVNRSEQLALYGMIAGFIGIAVAFITAGIYQVKVFEVWLPYIFIFSGVIFLALSFMLFNAIRRTSGLERTSAKGSEPTLKTSQFRNNLANFFSDLSDKIRLHLHYAQKYKLPIFIAVAFIAGVSSTMVLSNNFALPKFNLNLNFTSNAVPQNTSSPVVANAVANKLPVKIVDLTVTKTGDNYNVSFSLADKDSVKVATGGDLSLKIADQSNALYEESSKVSESDFNSLVYSKIIDGSKVNKSTSTTGTATVKFTSNLGVEMSSSANTELPILSPEAINADYQTKYATNAATVGKSVSKYVFEVTVVRRGFFSVYDSGTTKSYYRVDLNVKNLGAVETEFKTSTSKITVGGASYSIASESPFKTGNIKGNQIKEDYLLFKDVPTTISGTMQIRAGTTTAINEVEYIIED